MKKKKLRNKNSFLWRDWKNIIGISHIIFTLKRSNFTNFTKTANNTKNNLKKKNIFLSYVGTSTFAILRKVIVSRKSTLKEIKNDDLLQNLQISHPA